MNKLLHRLFHHRTACWHRGVFYCPAPYGNVQSVDDYCCRCGKIVRLAGAEPSRKFFDSLGKLHRGEVNDTK